MNVHPSHISAIVIAILHCKYPRERRLLILALLIVVPLAASVAMGETADERASRLGRAVHVEAAAIGKLPRFSYQTRYRYGVVDNLRAVDASLENMRQALSGPVREEDWIDYGRTFSWDDRRLIDQLWPGRSNIPYQSIFGTTTEAWIRSENKDRTRCKFSRGKDIVDFWSNPDYPMGSKFNLFDLGSYLRLTPHSFWWGRTIPARTTHTLFFAAFDEVVWESRGTEAIDGEPCDVIDALHKRRGQQVQRLWVGLESGRVRGVVSYFADSNPNELVHFDDYREIAPGIWLPFREVRAFPHSSDIRPNKKKLMRSEHIVEEARTDRDLSARYAELLPKDADSPQHEQLAPRKNH